MVAILSRGNELKMQSHNTCYELISWALLVTVADFENLYLANGKIIELTDGQINFEEHSPTLSPSMYLRIVLHF